MTTLPFPCHLQGSLSRATQEQKQLSEKLREEAEQKEQLRRMKNEMENERWHLDKTIEKLQKEVREQEEVREWREGAGGGKGVGSSPSGGLMKAKEPAVM